MSRVPIPFAPRVARGAFVQLVEQVVAYLPNVVVFQYNPETVTLNHTPWNPFEGQGPNRGTSAPDFLPYPPDETISFTLSLSATEGMESGNPVTVATGVASRIAALKKLTQASQGLLGDVVGAAMALKAKESREIKRDKIPLTFLIFGPGLIVPVRITSFSVEQTLLTPLLYPHEATVAMELRVLTPDLFKCSNDKFSKLAVSAYNFTKLQEDALAVANVANNVEEALSLLPI